MSVATKRIDFGGHYIEIELDGEGSGNLTSNLKDVISLDLINGYELAIDGLEALVLAQACAGIDVTTKEYARALEVAVEAISNNT